MGKINALSDNSTSQETSDNLFIDALFSSIGEGAIATDEFSRIVRINSIGLDILGHKEKDVLGKWFPSVVVAVNDDNSQVNHMERSITKAFITGKPVIENSYYLHKDGHKIPVTITVSPIMINNRPVGAINLFRNITQEYEIDRIKSEFISLASHQLRTPLSSIKLYSHMLIDGFMGNIKPAQKEALESVVEASDRMNQLTDTLLNITRVEAGAMTISKKEIDIIAIAKKAIGEQIMDAKIKGIDINLDSAVKEIFVNTDQFITKEIFTNLLSNAIKYTPNGGKITVSIKVDKEKIICSVSDTGIGIPEQAHKQIFSKFFRAQNVHERDTTGTGLGLYLIKSLAEHIDIPIWFESEEGKGTTFYFSLPACTAKNYNDAKTPKKSTKNLKDKG
jgi:PAS domain S-box-containing protein